MVVKFPFIYANMFYCRYSILYVHIYICVYCLDVYICMFSGWSLLSRVAIPSYHSYLETAMFCESVQYIWQPWVTQPWIFQIIRAHEPLRRCSIGKILVRSIRPKNLCELWKYVDVKAEECEMYEPERCQTNICLFGVKLVKPGEVGDTLCIYTF